MASSKFGKIIREHRMAKGWTQLELARKLGYPTANFISLLERDLSKTPLAVLGKLIVLLGIPEKKITDKLVNDFKNYVSKELSVGKKTANKRR